MDSKLRCVFAMPPAQVGLVMVLMVLMVMANMVTVVMVSQEEANGVEEEAKFAESKVSMEAKPAAPAIKVSIVDMVIKFLLILT